MNDEERTIFEKALQEAWEHYCNNGRLVDQFEDNYTECAFAKGFKAGYMQMLENPSGGALLHVCNKTAKITKRELIDKVCDFIDKETYEQPILTPSAEIHCVNLGMKHCNNKNEFIVKLKEVLQ